MKLTKAKILIASGIIVLSGVGSAFALSSLNQPKEEKSIITNSIKIEEQPVEVAPTVEETKQVEEIVSETHVIQEPEEDTVMTSAEAYDYLYHKLIVRNAEITNRLYVTYNGVLNGIMRNYDAHKEKFKASTIDISIEQCIDHLSTVDRTAINGLLLKGDCGF